MANLNFFDFLEEEISSSNNNNNKNNNNKQKNKNNLANSFTELFTIFESNQVEMLNQDFHLDLEFPNLNNDYKH